MAVSNLLRRPIDLFDRALDPITTFRLLIYLLLIYLAAGGWFAHLGYLGFSAVSLLGSAVVLLVAAKLSNLALSAIFSVPANHDSDLITALILALILTPAVTANDYLFLALAAAVAMLSKFIVTLRGRHIFNPAAFGAFIAALIFNQSASWWIGNRHMAALLFIGGLLVLRKTRRFEMALIFGFVYLFYIFASLHLSLSLLGGWHQLYLDIAATPLLFFGTVMLTEPLTSPTKQRNLLIFGVVVGIFYSFTQLHRTPEEALLIGNAAAFLLEPNRSLLLKLIGRRQEAADIFSFIFATPKKLRFEAGQYMEWTLPHTGIDARGNRRYLTIASAPTEDNIMFTVKVPPSHSKFKDSLMNLKKGEKIAATRLAGDFTLKGDNQKVAFIAGGVGITPFRSIIQELVDKGQAHDIHLFYSVTAADEIAFEQLFSHAAPLGIKTSYITTSGKEADMLHGYLDERMIKAKLPDYQQRLFYISGPQAFVAAIRGHLLDMGVKPARITTDFFPGYN